jgi:glycerophosphoryl diester phosphodiesterase
LEPLSDESAPESESSSFTRSRRPAAPIGFAHRGARAERRENTIEAFSWALATGAAGLESDAWITSDGVVVLDHDGVTGPRWRRRAISSQPRAALPAHIPALEDLYRTCGTGYELSLDLKDPAALAATLQVATAAGATDRLWLCHHDWRLMAGWRQKSRPAHLVESTNLSWMREGLAARAAALHNAGIEAVNLHRSQWDAAVLADVHAAGLLAFAWDAQSEGEIGRLLDLGLDGLYSDHVGRLVRAIRARRP